MKRVSFLLAGLLLTVFMDVTVWPQAEAQPQQEALTGEPDVVLHVEGMGCQMCARSMARQLKKLDAVEEVQVLLDEQKVLLTLKEGKTVKEEALRGAVTNAGFNTRKVDFAKHRAG